MKKLLARPSFNDPTPEAAAHRGQQAHVDADIEGLARDPQAEAMTGEMRAAGVPVAERMARLAAHLREKERLAPRAAE